MKGIVCFAILTLSLCACSESPKGGMTAQKIVTDNSKHGTFNLLVNNPVVLDSSDWVFYPLTLEELEETEEGFESSGYGRQRAYWNISFFNTRTKETRLLSDSLKMLINAIHSKNNTMTQTKSREKGCEGFILYTITTTDFNQDGKLNSVDPRYLFISDPSGLAFRQVSPNNYDLLDWQTTREPNKILIQARKDINLNKAFETDDETVSFIYDIDNQNLEQIFSDEFNLKTKKILESHWSKEK